MLFAEFFTWWYSRGFVELLNKIARLISGIWRKFSVPILLRTMFEPWKRIVEGAGGSIQDKAQALVDNMISRFVGFTIRLISIITALVIVFVMGLLGIVLVVAWPLAPLLVPLSVIVGLAS